MDWLRNIFGRGLPGVVRVQRGKGFAVGELDTAALLPVCAAPREGEERRITGGIKVRCDKTSASTYAWRDEAQRFNVLGFGAKGDGTTDDTAAFNAAGVAAAAAAGTIFIPPGSYKAGSKWTIPDGVPVFGAGMGRTTIISTGAFNVFEAVSKSKVAVHGLTIDMTGASGGSGVAFNDCADFSIERVEILGAGIAIGGGAGTQDDAVIRWCIIRDSTGHSISLANDCFRVLVAFNKCLNSAESGVNVSDSYHCSVIGNHCWNDTISTAGFGGVRFTNGSAHNTATGNTIRGFGRGLFIASTAGINNVVSTNTVLETNDVGCFVEVGHQSVIGNEFYNCIDGGGGGACIYLSNANYVAVSGNQIYDDRGTKKHDYGVGEYGTSNNNEIGPNAIEGFLTGKYLIIGAATNLYDGQNSRIAGDDAKLVGTLHVQSAVVAGDTVANTTSETTFAGSDYTLPANGMVVGRKFRITARGIMGTAAANTTLAMRVYSGSAIVASTGNVAQTVSLTAREWEMEVELTVSAVGSSGAVQTNGWFRHYSALGAIQVFPMNAGSVTVNTTVARDFEVRPTWTTADAANTITMQQYAIEVMS